MKIVHIPNAILTKLAAPVTNFDKRLQQIVADMVKTLVSQRDPEGVGLAAPQVGLSMRIFIIRPKKTDKTSVFINSEIMRHEARSMKHETQGKETSDKKLTEAKLEGCLSIPKIWGHVQREQSVTLRYQDLAGKWKKKKYTGFAAVIVQHEMDHLNGVLFTQRVLEQKGKLYREEKGELERYEI